MPHKVQTVLQAIVHYRYCQAATGRQVPSPDVRQVERGMQRCGSFCTCSKRRVAAAITLYGLAGVGSVG